MSGDTKNKLTLRKNVFFVIEKHIEDVKQGQKIAPDLLESIMKPTGLVKEVLRRISSKMIKFKPKVEEFEALTFRMSGKVMDFRQRFLQEQKFKPRRLGFWLYIDPVLYFSFTFFFFCKTRWLHYRFQQIRSKNLIPYDVSSISFHKTSIFLDFDI